MKKNPLITSFDVELANGVGLREALLIQTLLPSGENYLHLSLNQIKEICFIKNKSSVINLINNLIDSNIIERHLENGKTTSYRVNLEELNKKLEQEGVQKRTGQLVQKRTGQLVQKRTGWWYKNVPVGGTKTYRLTEVSTSPKTYRSGKKSLFGNFPEEGNSDTYDDFNLIFQKVGQMTNIFSDEKIESEEILSKINDLQKSFTKYISKDIYLIISINNNISILHQMYLRSKYCKNFLKLKKEENNTLPEQKLENDKNLENNKTLPKPNLDETIYDLEKDNLKKDKTLPKPNLDETKQTILNVPVGDNLNQNVKSDLDINPEPLKNERKPAKFQKTITDTTLDTNNDEKIDSKPISDSLKNFINVWISKGFKLPGTETKSYQTTLTYLKRLQKGTLFNSLPEFKRYYNNKFTLEDFIISAENFEKALSDKYKPENKVKLNSYRTLDKFLLSIYSNGTTTKSLFIYYFENEPQPMEPELIETNPEITNEIKKLFVEKILGGASVDFSQLDKNNFIKTGNLLTEFIEKNKTLIKPLYIDTPKKAATILFSSVISDEKLKQVTTGVLCSPYTFSQRIPSWLNKNMIMSSEKTSPRMSIYAQR